MKSKNILFPKHQHEELAFLKFERPDKVPGKNWQISPTFFLLPSAESVYWKQNFLLKKIIMISLQLQKFKDAYETISVSCKFSPVSNS